MIIAIDGPSGVGKSSVAKAIAEQLHYTFLDTGALYRSLAVAFSLHSICLDDEKALEEYISDHPLDLVNQNGTISYYVGGEDVTAFIRTPQASKDASFIAKHSFIRSYLLPIQRSFGIHQNIVCEGRDMGTTVFPHADVKIFLYADPEARAKRRFLQLEEKHTLQSISKEMKERDSADSSRSLSPLKPAEDAIIIDTSEKTFAQVVSIVLDTIERTPRYELFSHPADIGIRGIGRSVAEAFSQAGRALTSVIVNPATVKETLTRHICCTSEDLDTLFYDYLNEILYEMSVHHMLFSRFDVSITGHTLHATLHGEHFAQNRHEIAVEIKGATYYELLVQKKTNGLYIAQAVVDV